MPTRRTIFAAVFAVGIGGLFLSGKADDALRAVGLSPAPETREGDQRLVTAALADNRELLAVGTSLEAHIATGILQQQIEALGGSVKPVAAEPAVSSLAQFKAKLKATSQQRQLDAVSAASSDLAQTLASLAAGLAQLAASPKKAL